MPLILATVESGEPEIFASLQGEGPATGKPCAFIRLSRCNLACTWCDTPYTWHFTGDNRPHRGGVDYDRKANQVSLPETLASERIAALGMDRLVITGGEPLLQVAAITRLLKLLPAMHIEIETNGTVAPSPELDELIDQYNVSPKLAHSGNAQNLALIPERLAEWAENPRAWFKFVIAKPEDLDEVLELQARYSIPSNHLILMAEGTDVETLQTRELWLSKLCITNNFALSKRLHIQLFGDTRGT